MAAPQALRAASPDWRLIASHSHDVLTDHPADATSSSDASAKAALAVFYRGDYLAVLKASPMLRALYDGSVTSAEADYPALAASIHAAIGDAPLTVAQQHQLQQAGAAALLVFMQESWTGPLLSRTMQAGADSLWDLASSSAWVEQGRQQLAVHGEFVYALTPVPLFLWLAKVLLVDEIARMPDLEGTSSWWAGRVTVVQQRLQDHVTGTLAEQANAFFQQTLATLQALEAVPPSISARLHLEIGMQHHVHGRERVAKSSYEKAAEAHEFSFHLMGAQGRRTKHQIFSVNHLVVDVESKAAAAGQTEAVTPASENANQTAVPSRLELNDEILLEQITIDADQPAAATEVKKLHPIDQCILLAVCQDITDSNPEDALSSEQQKPFVRRVQESPQNWSVHTQALLIQARLESHKSRTVERAALQVQALVDQMVLDEPAAPERLEYIFCLAAPTRWELSRELGQRFVSIGAVRSGLEIFERLAMFEDMISCHQMLGETDQAKKLVQDLLAKSPTNPKYMCLMGDLEQDPSWWQQSWDASKGSFSRAMRALGSYHFREARFEEAVRCYKEAMRINPLFSNSWFIMGCAALRYDDWDEAANAFMRCVQIDADNGEAWTNLASTRLRQGRKRDAWHALREALRQQYDSFKIWENYLYVSVDLKEWQEALRAMQRIFELRWDKVTVDTAKKHVIDVEVMERMADFILADYKALLEMPAPTKAAEPSCVDSSVDAATMHAQKKQKALKLVQTMQALMAKIVNKIPTAPPLWIVLANFHEALGHAGRALECWRKVWRILINQPAVDSDDAVFTNAVRLGIAYCKALQRLGPVKEPARMAANQDEDPEATDGETTPEAAWTPVCADWMTQRKMAFRKLLALGRQNFDGSEIYTELEEAASAS